VLDFLHIIMPVLRCLAALVLLAECAFAAPPNIILITLDTTRADRIGFMGSARGLTPNLDELARESVIFSRAYTQVPLTTPSHAVMLTGTYPQFSHLQDLGAPLGKDLPYLPDLLRQHGYRTAAFVGAYILDPKGLTARGFGRGFDIYDAPFHKRVRAEDRYHSMERRAGDVVDHALAWLSKHPHGPFFLWLHFYDPHDPYDPPEPFKSRFASAPYDGEIAYTDSVLGKFVATLRARGLYSGALISVAADHGEAFGEHGERRHGIFLYDETIHVPLLFKLPGGRSAGNKIGTRVALADLAPTFLRLAGIAIPAAMEGQSLADEIRPSATKRVVPDRPQERPIYSESDYAHRAFGWSLLRSWRAGKYLYVQAPRQELYDQSVDPQSLHNLEIESKAVAQTMQAQLETFHNKTSSAQTEQARLDPAQAESLRALGYLASDSTGSDPNSKVSGIDPKDKIEIANMLHQALVDMEEDRYAEALPALERVIREEPSASTAFLELGRALVHLKEYQKALPVLRQAVEKMPASGMAHYELGLAMVKTGQWDSALPEFQAAVVMSPRSAQLHFYLGAVFARLKRVPEASKEFQTSLRLDPGHYQANLVFGHMLVLEGDATAALPKLQKAAKLQPDSGEPHEYLADAYSQLGQQEKARRERLLAERLGPLGQP
jgi:arylsulfatase A-like enzyme/Flp pilus assembly protein TadD